MVVETLVIGVLDEVFGFGIIVHFLNQTLGAFGNPYALEFTSYKGAV